VSGARAVPRPLARGADSLLAIALIALGGVLRFLRLGQQSFWHDEVHSVIMARGGDSGALSETVFNTHGPLYLLLLRGWMNVFGSGEDAARALSAVIGVLGLVAFQRVIRRYVDPVTALVALALLVLSPFHLGYSQEVRGYGLLFALGLLAVEACLVDIERRTAGSFVVALLVTLATCLSNLSGFFLVGLVGVFGRTAGRAQGYTLRRYALFVLLIAVLLEPWIVAGAQSTGKFNIGTPPARSDVILAKGEAPPGLASIPYSFYDFTLGRSLGPSVDELKLERLRALRPHLPYLVPVALLVGWLLVRGWRRADGARRTVLLPWLVLPIVAMALFSLVNFKAANSRYAFLGFAPFLLFLALGITSLAHRAARALALAAVLAVFAWSDVEYFTNHAYWKPDARATGALLVHEARADDAVIVYALDYPLRYYTPDSLAFLLPSGGAFESDSGAAAWIAANVRPSQRIWIVQCNAWWMDRADRFVRVCDRVRTRESTWRFDKLPVYRYRAAGAP
jgi:uncharacterized membrane protein